MRTGISFSPLALSPALRSSCRRAPAAHLALAPARRGLALTPARLAELAAAPFSPLPQVPAAGLVGSSHTSAARFAASIAAAIGVLSAFFLAVHF